MGHVRRGRGPRRVAWQEREDRVTRKKEKKRKRRPGKGEKETQGEGDRDRWDGGEIPHKAAAA
jgi:hypothetical protein